MKRILKTAALGAALMVGTMAAPGFADTAAAPVMDEVFIMQDAATSLTDQALAPILFGLFVIFALTATPVLLPV
ncbi:hypothetical protein [Maritimibacter fusiformis]|uniref:Uncharacterized protein n=1 Tax=Maritimibacter fusiformis TaxID=2603819 RepID=A0A5D0RIX3_9RHOB|nr:hypothetical protein [Maritimibacter fusiformis]TYB81373.1 hypothetical protein FVF75_09655 [Maritimibacter fusiformis]